MYITMISTGLEATLNHLGVDLDGVYPVQGSSPGRNRMFDGILMGL